MLALAILAAGGCTPPDWHDDPEEQVATPVFSPAAGTYAGPQSVIISSATPDAVIHYTSAAGGAVPPDPTDSSPVYGSPITVDGDGTTTTLKAIAVKAGMDDSPVVMATYEIIYSQVSAPQFSPAAGTYATEQSVTISSATPGASIRYTTDGSTPSSTEGTLYEEPIAVSASQTITAIAYLSGWTDSAISSASYVIETHSLYMTGIYDADGSGAYEPCYWKDWTRVPITDGAALDVFVQPDGRVLLSGFGADGACSWDDGVRHTLSLPDPGAGKAVRESQAKQLAVDGPTGPVYITGYYCVDVNIAVDSDGDGNAGNDWDRSLGGYWEDGVWYDLTGPSGESCSLAGDVLLDGVDLYVAGAYGVDTDGLVDSDGDGDASNDLDEGRACYWKNGTCVVLEGSLPSAARGIAVSADTVYAVGSVEIGGTETICTWTSGSRTDLDAGSLPRMLVSSGTVYVIGKYTGGTLAEAPAIWEGTVRSDLALPAGGLRGYAFGIAEYEGSLYVSGGYEADLDLGTDSDSDGNPANDRDASFACYWRDGERTDVSYGQGWLLRVY